MEPNTTIKLTKYSHGSGCGCKISPKLLSEIIKVNHEENEFSNLIVGSGTRDDAAVVDLGGGQYLISSADFFMPIVDDPFEFGQISAANAISDIYAMGGKPILAIALLGWPLDKIPVEVSADVLAGARRMCKQSGIPLGGGHSIDSPEPIFGLSVNGLVNEKNLKRNNTAQSGNLLFITKPLGIGILTTSIKKGVIRRKDKGLAERYMKKPNSIGQKLGELTSVHAMTDVTGFGLAGHLMEICRGSGMRAEIEFSDIPLITNLDYYVDKGCVPGGARRNWESFEQDVDTSGQYEKDILSDPQTSGGLLVSLAPKGLDQFKQIMAENDLLEYTQPIGFMENMETGKPIIKVNN